MHKVPNRPPEYNENSESPFSSGGAPLSSLKTMIYEQQEIVEFIDNICMAILRTLAPLDSQSSASTDYSYRPVTHP